MTYPIEPRDLLPCPFCGGKAMQSENKAVGLHWWQVECVERSCSSVGPTAHANEAEAIAAWNTRTAAEAASREELERYKAAYTELSKRLSWLQGHPALPAHYLGWHIADAASDLIACAYPEFADAIRAALSPTGKGEADHG
jgi:Lar family restriction alleviation protein